MAALHIWLTVLGGLAVFLAVVAVPLWVTFRYPERVHDYPEARAYLHAEATAAEPGEIASHVTRSSHDYASVA